MQDQSPAPAAPPGLQIERAMAGDELVGYRLRCGNNTLLAFEDQGAMPGFRLGDNFVGAFTGPKIEYAPVGLASPPAVMPAAPSDAVNPYRGDGREGYWQRGYEGLDIQAFEPESLHKAWVEGRTAALSQTMQPNAPDVMFRNVDGTDNAALYPEPAAGEQAGAVECERCGLSPKEHTASHWCDNQSYTVAAPHPLADDLMKLSQFAHTAAHMSESDMRNNLSSIADQLIALAAPGAAMREQDDPFECYAKGIASMINTSGGLSQAQGDWDIDHSAGRPILMYKKCSVIEAEDAEYVLRLIAADRASREEAPATPPAAIPAAPSDALRIHHEWSIRHMPGYSEDGDERVAYRATVLALTQPTTVQQPVDNDERVTRAVRELILLRHCLSYNASYCGETAGRVKQDVAGWERQGAKPLTFSDAGLSRLAAAVKGGA